jgi:hypothetical protein
MKRARKIILVVAAVAVLAGAGALESFNLLAARYRDDVRQELQKVLGQDVAFDGLEVNLLGRPGFTAKEFRIADDSRFAATPVVRARDLVLGVSLWQLLRRRLMITSLSFHEPEFQIITDESGVLNLTALVDRKTELRQFPRLRSPGSAEQRPFPVTFAINEVRIKRGRIDYVDRSIKQPAELRIDNLTMNIRGFEIDAATRIRLAASLTEGLGQDLRIEGVLTPTGENRSWLQRSVDLNVQFDSLHVPVVARAIAALRDKLPNELDVTGPMALHVQVRGTPERPRLEDVTLKVPLFGSSEYNAVISGAVHFTEQRSWEDAELKGKLAIEPMPLARLSGVRAFARLLPRELISNGTLDIYSRFEGTWQSLRLGVLVRADDADLRYPAWFHKPAEAPLTIRTRMARVGQELRIDDSELVFGDDKIDFSGAVDQGLSRRLRLKLRHHGGSLAAWNRFIIMPSFEAHAGRVNLELTVVKSLIPADDDWSLAGRLTVANAALKPRTGNRRIDGLQGEISFAGKQARLHDVRFRLGSSTIFIDGATANLFESRWLGTIRSPDLLFTDVPVLIASPPVRLKAASGAGEFYFAERGWTLAATVTAPEGSVNEMPFRELRTDVVLSAAGLSFKNLSARTFAGELRSEGHWSAGARNGGAWEISSEIDAVEIRALLTALFPPLRDRIEGRLSGHGRFQTDGLDNSGTTEALKGSGVASIGQGTLKHFNLISQLLLKGSGATLSPASTARLSTGLATLASRPDTHFDSLEADFNIDQKRLSSENLIFTTPDYSITAAGSIGFDRSTEWRGSLMLSPQLTEELQRDYRIIRYLLDRRGRLAISFRADGKLPNVAVRIENRALAQALRSGKAQKDGAQDDQPPGAGPDGKNWLPDALERFLKGG